MANYTAADVKQLRELTGSGMMDCKNALEESGGDLDKAIETLRIKGAKDAGKRAERTTAEGLIAGGDGVLIELNSETDFVAKNEEFDTLAETIVTAAKKLRTDDVETLKAADADGKTVDERISDLSATLGENLHLRRVASFDGQVASYLHRRGSGLPPTVGVLVEYSGDNGEAAHNAALQIAALQPRYLRKSDVPEDVVENERRIAEQTAREEGKPEQAIDKIIEGKVNAFFKDNVLLEQASVIDNKKTVQNLLDEAGVDITRFVRFEVGQS